MNRLTRSQWDALDDQMSRTPLESDSEGVPGEHMKLIALLNRCGFVPMSKREALRLAKELLDAGWSET